MSVFIHRIHIRLGFTIDKPYVLCRRSVEEKPVIDEEFYNEVKFLVIVIVNVRKIEDAEEVVWEAIDILTWEKEIEL